MTLLELTDVSISYSVDSTELHAVDTVSFDANEGEIIGIVGESGCGKTTLAKSILRLLPPNGRVTGGEITWKGQNLLQSSKKELNKSIRWKEISWIAQSAMNALDPVYTVEAQLRETLKIHSYDEKPIDEHIDQLLQSVGIDPGRKRNYPHELSGGQRQRVVIALALALDPPLIIADEPTTGLDVGIQKEILDLITEIQTDRGLTMLLITHDINVVAEIADRVLVMYAGQLIEVGSKQEIFENPVHPYTIGLQNAFPRLGQRSRTLVTIPGAPPNLVNPASGCRFKSRCPFATEKCSLDPPLTSTANGHAAKCHYTDNKEEFQDKGRIPETWVDHS